MRQKAFTAALSAALLLGMLAFPVSAQERAINYETYIVDSFDDAGDEEWSWIAAGSRFVTEGYPLIKYFDGMPNALRFQQSDPNRDYGVMGIQFKFNRQGDNWVDIIPVMAGEDGEDVPYEIPFRGVVSRLDLWVWGGNYMYELEVLVRDYQGRVHSLPMGWLNYEGWRNLAVNIPSNIPQTSRYVGESTNLKFVAFRIRTSPTERVDDFKVFFDQFRVLTDTYMSTNDGFEFADADFSDASYSYSDSNADNGYDDYYDDEEDSGL